MIVDLSPARTVLPPTPGRSQATVEARLRDAMRSLFEYRWSPTMVDMVKFDQLYSRLVVRRDAYDKENVAVELRGEPRPEVPTPTALDTLTIPYEVAQHPAVQTACATLAATGVGTFRLVGLTKETVAPTLPGAFDIGLVEKEGALYII